MPRPIRSDLHAIDGIYARALTSELKIHARLGWPRVFSEVIISSDHPNFKRGKTNEISNLFDELNKIRFLKFV